MHTTVENITDPVEEMLKRTGCIEKHYKVQECIAETQDWRKCQEQVKDFRKCMELYNAKKQQVEPTKFSTKMVIVVRTDLKLSSGEVAAQCAHAAVYLYESALKSSSWSFRAWLVTGQPKIILKVNDEATLLRLYEEAKGNKINVCLVHDAGKTEVVKSTLTALGLGPHNAAAIDKLTKHLKLL